MKKFLMFSVIVFCLFLAMSPVYAWGPTTHLQITWDTLKELGNLDNIMTRLIRDHTDYFYTGLMMPDITVIFYYSTWTSYQSTHDVMNFYNELWTKAYQANSPCMEAFAFGVGCHLIQDSVSHNSYVPQKISSFPWLQNAFIHPIVEAVVEGRIIDENGTAQLIAEGAFSKWNVPFPDVPISDAHYGYSPIDLVNEVTGRPKDRYQERSFYNVSEQFNSILSEGDFKMSFMGWSFGKSSWAMFQSVSGLLKNLIPRNDADLFIKEAADLTADWIKSGDPSAAGLNNKIMGDPTGWDKIESANIVAATWTGTIIVFIDLFVVYLVVRARRKVAGMRVIQSALQRIPGAK